MKLLLKKMRVENFPDLQYFLNDISMNDLVGKEISIGFTGHVECIHCARKVKKTFNQGYCFPCAQSLARCDLCIVKPERCHYAKGTCREPEWGEKHCLIEHCVYLANSAGLKVGITRGHQKETRWADQGAVQAMEIARVPERLVAGQLEVALKDFLSDRTDWRKLITGKTADIDLMQSFYELKENIPQQYQRYLLADSELEISELSYPVLAYPPKAKSFNAAKQPLLTGVLQGIRGQYLLFDEVAINIRKYQGYEVNFSTL